MVRKNAKVEVRMLSEYLLKEYPKFPVIKGCPLGKVDEALMAKEGYQRAIGLSRPYRPEVDAVVVLPRYLLIIEAKVWNVVNGLAKLPLYKSLVPVTPELQEYRGREVLMELVVGWTNSNLEVMARDLGVTIKVYSPDWLGPIVQKQHDYWTAPYQAERERKLQLRRQFGVD